MKYDTRLCWLPTLGQEVTKGLSTCLEMARSELERGLGKEAPIDVQEIPDQDEGYEITTQNQKIIIRGGKRGVLYGAYALMMRLAADIAPNVPWSEPEHPLRMLNHWDNMDGSIERGYAGKSLFFEMDNFVMTRRGYFAMVAIWHR